MQLLGSNRSLPSFLHQKSHQPAAASDDSRTLPSAVDTSDIIKKLSSAKSEREAEMRGAFLIVFESLDKDHGGTLDVDGELLTGLHSLGQDVVLADLRLAMESVIKRPHDRMVKTGVFQKVKVWDEITEVSPRPEILNSKSRGFG